MPNIVHQVFVFLGWLLKLSRHDRKLEPGTLEEKLRAMDHQRAQLTYKNRLCVTVHKGNMYRIINVTDKTTDNEYFEKQGVRVTVAQYFRDAYNIEVQGKQLVEAKETRGASRICLLPASLLRIVAQAPPVKQSQAFLQCNKSSGLREMLEPAKISKAI